MIATWASGGSVADGASHVISPPFAISSAVVKCKGEGGYEEGGEW